ncbi:MAG: hypothetical protein E7527_02320 [Ruminococcaceae bacterium]|nr:hypothetical protein [Oscillospiraceae bacterium]
MKKPKIPWKTAFWEIVGELALYVAFFVVGALVLDLCGVDFIGSDVDFEWIVLIGLGVLVVLAVVGYIVYRLVKKKAEPTENKTDE